MIINSIIAGGGGKQNFMNYHIVQTINADNTMSLAITDIKAEMVNNHMVGELDTFNTMKLYIVDL